MGLRVLAGQGAQIDTTTATGHLATNPERSRNRPKASGGPQKHAGEAFEEFEAESGEVRDRWS